MLASVRACVCSMRTFNFVLYLSTHAPTHMRTINATEKSHQCVIARAGRICLVRVAHIPERCGVRRSAWNVRTLHWPYCLVRSLALRPCRATRQCRLDDDTDNDNNIGSNDVICPSYNSPYYNSTRCGVVAGTHTHCITSISLRSHNTPNNRHVVHANTTSIEEEAPPPPPYNFTLIQ